MRTTVVTVVVAACALLSSAATAGIPAPGYTDTLVAGSLSAPTAIAFLPDGRLLITEKGGALKLKAVGPATTLVTIPVCSGSEMGLLGIAVDPDFGTNGYVYLYRTENTDGCGTPATRSNEVVRVAMAGDDSIDIGSLTVLLTGIRTDNGNHDGGVLRVGPDGKLYVGAGDTGNGDNKGCPGSSTNPYAQDLGALEGKVLRLNLDGSIPADNPFVGVAGAREEVFAFGFRNPFRLSFDPVSGALWLGDVGDFAFEEVDIVTAGGNYGWPACEGANHPAGCGVGADPVFQYSHGGGCPGEGALPNLGTSITGGAFAGAAFGPSSDAYVFGDYTRGALYQAQPTPLRDGIAGAPAAVVTSAGGPVDVVPGPDGAIYYVAISNGEVRRLAVEPPDPNDLLFGTKMNLKVAADPAGKRLAVVSKDPISTLGAGNGSADDPVLNGGTVRVVTADGCGGPCDTTYTLHNTSPTDTWTYLGRPGENRGYKYKSKATGFRATVKSGRVVKITGRGALGHDLQADPTPVAVRLSIGGHNYCMDFGGEQAYSAGRSWKARSSLPPAGCLP